MTVVDHVQASELFSAYWERDLGPAESAALEEHLRSCVVCRREYQQFEQAVGALHHLEKQVAPPDFVAGVIHRVHRRSRGRFFDPRRTDRIPYELFSLVMLALLLAIYLILQLQPGRLDLR